jgi:hypothetical protein
MSVVSPEQMRIQMEVAAFDRRMARRRKRMQMTTMALGGILGVMCGALSAAALGWL